MQQDSPMSFSLVAASLITSAFHNASENLIAEKSAAQSLFDQTT
jgi:hypothetical protein